MRNRFRQVRAAVVLASLLGANGCFLVAAGAGAGAAVAFTNRGAKSVVDASVEQVLDRSTTVFEQLGIIVTGRSTEDSGLKGRLIGNKGPLEVTVELGPAGRTTTNVEVIARKSPIDYDRDFARDVLNRIISRL